VIGAALMLGTEIRRVWEGLRGRRDFVLASLLTSWPYVSELVRALPGLVSSSGVQAMRASSEL
jgi:hypothetical protein